MRLFYKDQYYQAINILFYLYVDINLILISLSQLIIITMQLPLSNKCIVPGTMPFTSNILIEKINNINLILLAYLLTSFL